MHTCRQHHIIAAFFKHFIRHQRGLRNQVKMNGNPIFDQLIGKRFAGISGIAINKYLVYHMRPDIFVKIICVCYYRHSPDRLSLARPIYYDNTADFKVPIPVMLKIPHTFMRITVYRQNDHNRFASLFLYIIT